MINIVIAFIILWIAMFITIKVLNFIFALFDFPLPEKEKYRKDIQNTSWWEKIIEAILECLQWLDFSSNNANPINSVNADEIETSAVCGELAVNVEGLEEGIQAVVESAGEHIIIAIEGLSNS